VALQPRGPYMFFRPEEYGIPSIIADDVPSVEGPPIDGGQEQARVCLALLHPPTEALVHLKVYGTAAVGARGLNLNLEPFVSQAPLHERRSKRVLPSSTEDVFAGAEVEMVRGTVGGDGESPGHVPAAVPNQEKEMLLEVIEQGDSQRGVESQRPRNDARSERPAVITGQFPDHEVPHRVVARRHEGKSRIGHYRNIRYRIISVK
jgi:hypothetical protein